MKRIMFLAAAFLFVASLAFAQNTAEGANRLILKGDIIDNMCANAQPIEALDSFIRTHTKECALMPTCAASGYSIYADGELMKFDRDSNVRIEAFLKQADSKLQVEVEAEKVGDELRLISIRNQ